MFFDGSFSESELRQLLASALVKNGKNLTNNEQAAIGQALRHPANSEVYKLAKLLIN